MTEPIRDLASAGKSLKWVGIFMMVLGILALASPLMTGISLVVMLGFMVLVGGVLRLVWAIQGKALGPFPVITAVLTILCGLVMVSDPILASGFLTVLIALYLIFDGIAEMVSGFRMRPGPGWGWMVFGGIISLLLGIMIWKQYPLSGAWAMGLFLGFRLLFVGLTMAGVGGVVQKSGS